jgi:acyl-coenzyme A synthetase/AMP-(fatty) acid ligase/acyl carrier protein
MDELSECSIKPIYQSFMKQELTLKMYSYSLQKDLMNDINEFCRKHDTSIHSFFQANLLEYLYFVNFKNNLIFMGNIKRKKNNYSVEDIDANLLVLRCQPTFTLLDVINELEKSVKENEKSLLENDLKEKFQDSIKVFYSFIPLDSEMKAFSKGLNSEFIMNFDSESNSLNVLYLENLMLEKELELIIGRILHLAAQNMKRPSKNTLPTLNQLNILPTTEEKLIMEFNDYKMVENNRFLNSKGYPKETAKRKVDIFEESFSYDKYTFTDVLSCICKKYSHCYYINDGSRRLTFQEIDKVSNSVAHYIIEKIKNLNRKPNDIVIPIISKKNWPLVASMYGIIKSGCVALLIDPSSNPPERLKYILQEVKATFAFYDESISRPMKINENENYYEDPKVEFISLNRFDFDHDVSEVKRIGTPQDKLFVFFTSGSTGKPKGVTIQCNTLMNVGKYVYDVTRYPLEKSISVASIGFVAFILELAYNMLCASELYLVSDEKRTDIPGILSIIFKEKVRNLFLTPSYFNFLVGVNGKMGNMLLEGIRNTVFLGESINNLSLPSRKFIQDHSEGMQFNVLLGSTESLMISLETDFQQVTNSVGHPIDNVHVYILDEQHQLCPVGFEGELCISAGHGISNNYIHLEGENQKSFIPNPFTSDENHHILFKTGDIARWNSSGCIEYVDRKDSQIKVRGRRIELGEIEDVMKKMAKVQSAAVVKKVLSGNECLVGYYIGSQTISYYEFRKELNKFLPTYMIPNYFVKLNELYYNTNGKLNRKAFPDPSLDDILNSKYLPLETPTEKRLAEIFSHVFNIDVGKIGRKSSFVELGGDSVKAIEIISEIQKKFSVRLSLKKLSDYLTIESLAHHITDQKKLKNNKGNMIAMERDRRKIFLPSPPPTPTPFESESEFESLSDSLNPHDETIYPITSQQMDIYLYCVKHEESVNYNISTIFKLSDDVDIDRLKQSIIKLMTRHTILKSRFESRKISDTSTIYGIIDENMEIEFEEYHWNTAHSFVRPFNLRTGPLIRIGFIDTKYILVDIHHIIFDGYSLKIFMEDLNKLYYIEVEEKEYSDNDDNEFEDEYERDRVRATDVNFSDYALSWDHRMKKGKFNEQLEFYRRMFEDEDFTLLSISNRSNESLTNDDDEDNDKKEEEKKRGYQGSKINQKKNFKGTILTDQSLCEKIRSFKDSLFHDALLLYFK